MNPYLLINFKSPHAETYFFAMNVLLDEWPEADPESSTIPIPHFLQIGSETWGSRDGYGIPVKLVWGEDNFTYPPYPYLIFNPQARPEDAYGNIFLYKQLNASNHVFIETEPIKPSVSFKDGFIELNLKDHSFAFEGNKQMAEMVSSALLDFYDEWHPMPWQHKGTWHRLDPHLQPEKGEFAWKIIIADALEKSQDAPYKISAPPAAGVRIEPAEIAYGIWLGEFSPLKRSDVPFYLLKGHEMLFTEPKAAVWAAIALLGERGIQSMPGNPDTHIRNLQNLTNEILREHRPPPPPPKWVSPWEE